MPQPTQADEPIKSRADGDWWVLLVTDGLTIEFPPELYREHDDAAREAERWARVLSARSGVRIERPFQDRWQVGDEWIRLTPSFLSEDGHEIWVGTYWTRDGSPEPEAELFADGTEARSWVREPAAGAALVESHQTPWSSAARYRVRGGEEEAEAHRAKIVAAASTAPMSGSQIVYGFEVSEGGIPQGPDLYTVDAVRDRALREFVEEMSRDNWKDFVTASADGNYVEGELPPNWRERWDQRQAIDWLLGFDFISDGDNLEIRRFITSIARDSE